MLSITQLVQTHPELLLNRDFIIDLVSTSIHSTDPSKLKGNSRYYGKLIEQDNKIFIISNTETLALEEISVSSRPYMDAKTKFSISEEFVPNVTGTITTSLGNLIANYHCLTSIFGNVIPYWNKKWNYKAISKLIVEAFHNKLIDVDQIYRFQDAMNFLPGLSDFFSVSITKKCITLDPIVKKRREEIRAEITKGHITPEQAVLYEDELIALDKKSHEGDEAVNFLSSSKNYNVHRKRFFLGIGLVEDFGDSGADFEYVNTILDEGWDPKDLPAISNEIRRGSYMRGKETAVGGAIMKLLARIFQELKIVTDDCGSTKTIEVTLTKELAPQILSRTIVESGKLITLTKANIDSYIGKVINLRSAMTCKAKGGMCYTCLDGFFRDLDITNLNLLPMNIGSTIQALSMASMHNTKMELSSIDSLDRFLV